LFDTELDTESKIVFVSWDDGLVFSKIYLYNIFQFYMNDFYFVSDLVENFDEASKGEGK